MPRHLVLVFSCDEIPNLSHSSPLYRKCDFKWVFYSASHPGLSQVFLIFLLITTAFCLPVTSLYRRDNVLSSFLCLVSSTPTSRSSANSIAAFSDFCRFFESPRVALLIRLIGWQLCNIPQVPTVREIPDPRHNHRSVSRHGQRLRERRRAADAQDHQM